MAVRLCLWIWAQLSMRSPCWQVYSSQSQQYIGKTSIYTDLYYLQFQSSTGGVGRYSLCIRGDWSIVFTTCRGHFHLRISQRHFSLWNKLPGHLKYYSTKQVTPTLACQEQLKPWPSNFSESTNFESKHCLAYLPFALLQKLRNLTSWLLLIFFPEKYLGNYKDSELETTAV